MVTGGGVVDTAHTATHSHTPTAHTPSAHTATTTASPTARALACLGTPTSAGRSRGPLHRKGEIGGNRPDIESLANEIAQRNDKIMRMDGAAGDQFAGRTLGQPHLLLGPKKNDVGKRGLDSVTNTARAIRLVAGWNECDRFHGSILVTLSASCRFHRTWRRTGQRPA